MQIVWGYTATDNAAESLSAPINDFSHSIAIPAAFLYLNDAVQTVNSKSLIIYVKTMNDEWF